MNIIKTKIPGLLIIEPDVYEDSRGYFFESYQYEKYLEAGINCRFLQDNESKSARGVVRGLHYQLEPYAQAKLVRVIYGNVFDVAVDIRKGSPTFGQWFGTELNGGNKKQLFIPKGFAHGFSVLSETAVFAYKCDTFYSKEAERAIKFNDPALNINWRLTEKDMIISAKDNVAPLFNEVEINFNF
ncbi:dTDP-4-dehydrorhamnose 3,5-epimerase [hydrothermal vent metagenome]|uniref:dTDP-4-dehydrorhamnose 3,5-epimerase n=1 Tax=hydrothermal vent metagenome TaxID=652676 RepID=A0A3B0U5L5_9ZZZZ